MLRSSSVVRFFALAASLAACGGDDAVVPTPDAGIDFDAGFVVAPTALPVLTPCPTGWREVRPTDPAAPVTCEPYGATGPEVCVRGSAHFPGTAGCSHLGPACPLGDYAEDLPTDREVRYVRPSADPSGIGTLARPYRSLAQAAMAAPTGAVLALAKGTYREAVAFPPKDLTLIGACVEETILEAPTPATDSAIVGGGAGRVEFRRVTFTGASPAVIVIDTAVFDLEDVLIDRASFVALYALFGGQITGRRVVVQDTQLVGGFGRAVFVEQGGRVSFIRALVTGHHDIAVMAIDVSSSIMLEDSRITGTQPTPDGHYGRALDVEEGAQLALSHVFLDGNAEYGVFCGGLGAVATLTDVVIRDTQLDAHGGFGRGLHAQAGGAIHAMRVLIDGAHEVGIHATAAADPPGDALVLDDVVIRDVGPNGTDLQGGRGLQAQWGASVTAHRLYISDVTEIGVLIASDATRAVLEDVTVVDTRGGATGRLGQGVSAIDVAQLTLRRAHVARVLDIGVMIADGAQLDAEDLLVEHIESELDRGEGGIGLYARGATVTVARAVVRDVRQLGAYVAGAELRVTGFSVAHCALAGVQLADGGAADLVRGRVADNPIGANVQTPGFDFARLTSEVVFERNERAVDGATLPIPESRLPGTLAF